MSLKLHLNFQISESSVHEGVCNITTWIMLKESCLRNSNYYFTYDVFAFEVGYLMEFHFPLFRSPRKLLDTSANMDKPN